MAQRFEPRDLLEYYEKIRDTVSREDLFNRPEHSKTLELWVAAQFGLGYSDCFRPCAILIDDVDLQLDYDFELEVDGRTHPFQITEVQEPGRRRGLEYRGESKLYSKIEDWSPGTNEGPDWVYQAIVKKLEKKYSTAENLNLLLYLNYPAYAQNYGVLKARCSRVANAFGSTWLITGDAICCIAENPALGIRDGWCKFTEYDRSEPEH